MPRLLPRLAVAAAVALGWPAAAPAQVIVNEGFEVDPYAGLPYPFPPGGPSLQRRTNGVASAGSASYYIAGSNLATGEWAFLNLYTGWLPPIPAGTARIRFSGDVRIDNGFASRPNPFSDLIRANLLALDTQYRPLAAVSASADGHAYGGTAAGGPPHRSAGPAAAGAFHRLGMDLDFAAGTALFTLDGATIGTDQLAPGLTAQDFGFGVLEIAGEPAAGGYDPRWYSAFFDEVRIEAFPAAAAVTTPEPTTLGLALAGGLGLAARRLRRRGSGV